MTGSFYTPSLLVIARTEPEVRHALDVLDGKAATLAARRSPVVDGVREGSMALAWAEGLADSSLPFRSQIITKSEAVGIVVGEKGGEVFATLRLVMQNKDTAQKMLAVLEGMRSAAELQYEGNSSMMKILKKLTLAVSEKTVNAGLRAGRRRLEPGQDDLHACQRARTVRLWWVGAASPTRTRRNNAWWGLAAPTVPTLDPPTTRFRKQNNEACRAKRRYSTPATKNSPNRRKPVAPSA